MLIVARLPSVNSDPTVMQRQISSCEAINFQFQQLQWVNNVILLVQPVLLPAVDVHEALLYIPISIVTYSYNKTQWRVLSCTLGISCGVEFQTNEIGSSILSDKVDTSVVVLPAQVTGFHNHICYTTAHLCTHASLVCSYTALLLHGCNSNFNENRLEKRLGNNSWFTWLNNYV